MNSRCRMFTFPPGTDARNRAVRKYFYNEEQRGPSRMNAQDESKSILHVRRSSTGQTATLVSLRKKDSQFVARCRENAGERREAVASATRTGMRSSTRRWNCSRPNRSATSPFWTTGLGPMPKCTSGTPMGSRSKTPAQFPGPAAEYLTV